ncbi:MAG: tartrate dehydrogenase [Chloroflexota bacterium]|nr:tartrate dehydrogenase [Chloroflexota bacterium]
MPTHSIAVIPGDGIGLEVIREGRLTLETLSEVTGDLILEFEDFPWGCQYYLDHGEMMPSDALKTLEQFDAIYFGACGFPSVPDPISQREMILLIRQSFQQYANIRPVRIWPGVPSPLAPDRLEGIDFICVRENSEGEYAGAGGRVHKDTPYEVALQTTVFTRVGVERVIRHAFELTERLGRRHVTNVTKSNALQFAPVFWDEVFDEVAGAYPAITTDRNLVDACAARMVGNPQTLDVLVASNLFGDILSDIGGALMGSLGVPPSANLGPGTGYPPMFEPVHGSAPDIAGQEIANPLASIWSAAMMVETFGDLEAANLLLDALADVTRSGVLTVDLGGTASTGEFGEAVRRALKARAS